MTKIFEFLMSGEELTFVFAGQRRRLATWVYVVLFIVLCAVTGAPYDD